MHNNRYFLNIFLDTTFGVGVLYLFLKAADKYFVHMRMEGLRTGDYGNPPQFERWWKQTFVFSLGLVVMKIVVVIVLTWVRLLCHLWSISSLSLWYRPCIPLHDHFLLLLLFSCLNDWDSHLDSIDLLLWLLHSKLTINCFLFMTYNSHSCSRSESGCWDGHCRTRSCRSCLWCSSCPWVWTSASSGSSTTSSSKRRPKSSPSG